MWPEILVVFWILLWIVFILGWMRFMNRIGSPPTPDDDDFDGSKLNPRWQWDKKDHDD